MLIHQRMVEVQADRHELIATENFTSKEELVLYLMHSYPYSKVVRLAHGKRVLDLGCNTGYGTAMIFESTRDVVGVDVMDSAIAMAKQKFGSRGVQYEKVDGSRLPFADGEFDVVVSFQVIEHIVDQDLYIGEIKRVLSPDGIVVFTTPNSRIRLDPGMKPWNEMHVQEFDASGLELLLRQFFPKVHVAGLTAEPPTYAVEFDRAQKSLQRARQKLLAPPAVETGFVPTIKAGIKAVLPQPVVQAVRDLIASSAKSGTAHQQALPLGPAALEMHKLTDFRYVDHDLEGALDLLAICGNQKSPFDQFITAFD